jgi:hypothetical protein
MLIPESKSKPEKRLAQIYAQLAEAERKSLLDFAEYLASRSTPAKPESLEPKPIPRPEEENVVAALKRLRETYHMLDHSRMLNEASALMAQHLMQGRPAKEVIDELEEIFRRDFDKFLEQMNAQ